MIVDLMDGERILILEASNLDSAEEALNFFVDNGVDPIRALFLVSLAADARAWEVEQDE